MDYRAISQTTLLPVSNEFWVIRETNFTAGPNPDSPHRSIAFVSGARLPSAGIDRRTFFVPLFTQQARAEAGRE